MIQRRTVLGGLLSTVGSTWLSACAHRTTAMVTAKDPTELGLTDASRALRTRQYSPVELTEASLARIAAIDPRLNSFITVTRDRALADAQRAQKELRQGRRRGPLHGIPIALKDNIDTAGILTTAATKAFAERVPTVNADIVRRLQNAGAVLLGKLNMHELAYGTTSVISGYGPVHNPWNLEYSAGGSSGGCGAAVAANLCYAAVGTDTGGSLRVPAAACGVVGLKPTYGIIDTDGVVPLSKSFDHLGPLCRNVADTALMFSQMTDHPIAKAVLRSDKIAVKDLRVGVVRNISQVCDGQMDLEVQANFDVALGVIRNLVAKIADVALPYPSDLARIIDAEAYATHSATLAKSADAIDPRTRELLMSGKKIPQNEYERRREALQSYRAQTQDVFKEVDLVILPTIPTPPVEISQAMDAFAVGSCTFAFSLGGWPALSVPCGFSKSRLPVGLLIGGPALSEPRIFALAQAYENATTWHEMRPKL